MTRSNWENTVRTIVFCLAYTKFLWYRLLSAKGVFFARVLIYIYITPLFYKNHNLLSLPSLKIRARISLE